MSVLVGFSQLGSGFVHSSNVSHSLAQTGLSVHCQCRLKPRKCFKMTLNNAKYCFCIWLRFSKIHFFIMLVFINCYFFIYLLIGRGVFALEPILKGSFILEYRGVLKKTDKTAWNEYTYIFNHKGTEYWWVSWFAGCYSWSKAKPHMTRVSTMGPNNGTTMTGTSKLVMLQMGPSRPHSAVETCQSRGPCEGKFLSSSCSPSLTMP